MFESCHTLAELNQSRKAYVAQGVPQIEVNAAYNKAKASLMQATPSFRTIPMHSCEVTAADIILPLPIAFGGKPSEIIITPEGVLL